MCFSNPDHAIMVSACICMVLVVGVGGGMQCKHKQAQQSKIHLHPVQRHTLQVCQPQSDSTLI